MIYNTSRYSDGPVVDVTDFERNMVRKVVFRKWPTSRAQFAMYTWQNGDRVDLVAQKFFGSPDTWWQIMDWNPELVDPTYIRPGTQIRLPL